MDKILNDYLEKVDKYLKHPGIWNSFNDQSGTLLRLRDHQQTGKVADFICKGKHCVSPFAKAAERGISVFLLAGDNRGAAAQKILFAYRKGQRISAVYENRMEESFICNFRLGGKRKWIKF